MQPSTHQTAPGASVAGLPAGLLAVVVVAGSAGLFAIFWDDAWHTDLGRDQATIPPHLLLYASMATIGAVVAAWGLSALRRGRSPAAVWRQPPLQVAAAGGAVTLAALPIDAAWHAGFGRDAVLWSPPHMLAVFGSLALLVGFLGAARPDTPLWILTGLGALLLGSAAVPVLEFETDVPQFSETLYLAVLLATTLFAAWVLRQVIPGPLPVARAVGIYVLLRVAITVGLAAMGRSTPDLPLAILGLAAVDLPWRTAAARYAGGAAGVALILLVASAAGLASVDPGAVALVAVPGLVVFLVVVAAQVRWSSQVHGAALLLLVAGAVALSPASAEAHDPGQGRPIAPVTLTGTSDGRGGIAITADSANDCAALPPRRLLARRAGQTVTGTLTATGHCRYAGQVHVPATGRWFVYVELRPPGFEVEAWLPVDASSTNRLVQHRQLYLPAGRTQGARLPGSEVAAGIVLYALGALLLALIIRQVRGPARTQPVLHSARTPGATTHGDGVGHRRAPGRLGP
ncbi:MAG TPA: hypothetical protein VFN05_07420 [Actinomycetes bacterium]|nr:hypothetical protein [Actinomycetes bacterium]